MVRNIRELNPRAVYRSLPVVLERPCPKVHLNHDHTTHEFGYINDGRPQGFDRVV